MYFTSSLWMNEVYHVAILSKCSSHIQVWLECLSSTCIPPCSVNRTWSLVPMKSYCSWGPRQSKNSCLGQPFLVLLASTCLKGETRTLLLQCTSVTHSGFPFTHTHHLDIQLLVEAALVVCNECQANTELVQKWMTDVSRNQVSTQMSAV